MFFLLLWFFLFNDPATTEIYTLSLHDALPISSTTRWRSSSAVPCPTYATVSSPCTAGCSTRCTTAATGRTAARSEEHTSELQSHVNLVCRLLLEKKKKTTTNYELSTALHAIIT